MKKINTKVNLIEYQKLCKRTAKTFSDKEKEASRNGRRVDWNEE